MENLRETDSSTDPLHILYVEDDLDDQEAFTAALKDIDTPHKVTLARDCIEVLDDLNAGRRYDLIFLDINMPVMDGKQCLAAIKKREEYRSIPVVVLSMTERQEDIDLMYNLGAHYHIVKPYAHINLLVSMKHILSLDWRNAPPVPSRENFVINNSFTRA